MKFSLAIFDLDDTLVHLDIDWDEVAAEIIRCVEGRGGRIPEKIRKADPMDIANYVSQSGHKALVVELMRKSESACIARNGCMVFPSMIKLVKDLKAAGYLIAIASGNTAMTISEALGAEGIKPDFIAGQDTVMVNKPYPDILNLILQQLKVKKEDAIFIGNSSFDSRAGKRAGIKTVIIKPNDDGETLRKILL